MKESFSTVKLSRRTALAAFGAASAAVLGERLMSIDANPSGGSVQGAPLPAFNESSRQKLQRLLADPSFSGKIAPTDVDWLAKSEGRSSQALMTDLLPLARSYARPPISNYRVGAVARGASGALYFGANIEFQGQALGFSVHAEQSALSNAYMHSEVRVSAIAVTAAPCGHCRQFMMELSPDGAIDIMIPGASPVRLSTLLPMAFGPKDLGLDHGALPVRETELSVSGSGSDEAVAAALAAARHSWSPYAKAPSGVALQTRPGRIFKGSYIENVAFNPSLPPFQTALAALIVAGEDGAHISRAVLVEVEMASISQRTVSEIALAAIAPNVRLQVAKANRRGN